MKRTAAVVVIAIVSTTLRTVAPAHAAPSNDDYADAALIDSLPFTEMLDISGATPETSETMPSCATNPALPHNVFPAPAAGLGTVWYRIEPTADVTITIDPSASDFLPTVAVYEGHDLLTQQEVACARGDVAGTLTMEVAAETSYAIQMINNSNDGTTLSFMITEPVSDLPGVGSIEPFEVLAGDGTPLRGHIYLPEGEGPFAPVLEYSPYWNTSYAPSEAFTQQDGSRTTMAGWLRPLMDAGFAVALVNVRGTGESGGCHQWGGPIDWSDAAIVVEALADTDLHPWSNGNVGMYGLSFPGWSQFWAIASRAAPSLKAVVPVSPVTDPWALWTSNGATLETLHFRMPIYAAGYTTGTMQLLLNQTGTPFVPDTEVSHATCPRYAEDIANTQPVWNGDRTPFWHERDLRPHIDGTDVAVFATLGLHLFQGFGGGRDLAFEEHASQLDGLWDLLAGDRRIMLGQWGHEFPKRADFDEMAVAWLDHHLRGGPEVVASDVVEYQDDTGAWHTAASWPPAASETTLYLSDGDLVTETEHVQASHLSFLSNGLVPCAGLCFRPVARRIPGCRGGDLVYVSEPLAEEIVIAGHFTVDLTIESSLPDGTLSSFLYHTDAADPCSAPELIESGRAVTDLRHAITDEGADFPVATPTAVTLTSRPLASRIPAGHRLVLTVGSASWHTEPDPYRPELTVMTGPDVVGELTLPLVQTQHPD